MTKIYSDGFIGYEFNSITTKFAGSDKEEPFLNNLKTQPDDWYYRTNEISYTYNEYGHRCKSIKDIDLDNYILFTGCSHTEGVGLKLEDTFPYKVSKDLNCDYYNLAVAGTGMDIVTHNLTIWYKTVKKLPKMLFIQNPEINRFAIYDFQYNHFHYKVAANADRDSVEFMMFGEKIGFFQSRQYMSNVLINELYRDCKIFEIEWQYPNGDSFILPWVDKARDLSHSGVESNRLLVNDIVNSLI